MKLAVIKDSLSRALPFLIFCAFLCNFVVSCVVYRSAHPRFIYETHVTTNYIHSVVTNYLSSSLVSPTSSVTSVSSQVKPSRPSTQTHIFPYEYFVISGRSVMRYFGKVYFEGDICSLGLILRIFPDKVFFHNGDVLQNDLPPRRSDSPSNKRLNHD